MKKFFQRGELRVKICGVTNLEDAKLSVDAGADALGFNLFSASRRHVRLDTLEKWINEIPPEVARIAVVVNATKAEIREFWETGFFDAIQFHGDETATFCLENGAPLWLRAIRVNGADAFLRALEHETEHLLFDAFSAGEYGGTGHAPDWNAIAEFRAAHEDRNVVLAGGLKPENVEQAVKIVRPHAVDVASGVESSPGKKDRIKVRQFIASAKKA